MLLAMVLPACSDSDEGKGEGDNSLQPRVEITLTRSESVTMNKQNNFGFKMLKNVVNNSTNTNVAVSPYSMSQVLAMLANGAKGDVHNEIVGLLSDAGTNIDEINGYYKKLNEGIATTDKTTKIEIVNGLWAAKGYPFTPDFEKVNTTYYGAIVQSFDTYGDVISYYKKNMSENISSAVAEVLKNMDEQPVKDFSLNNTIYFKGIWKNKFNVENTSSQPFYGENGAGVAKMMSRSLRCPLYVGRCCEAVQLDYGNGAFSMMVVPLARTAPIMIFMVAPTETTSRLMRPPVSPVSGAVAQTKPLESVTSAPMASNPLMCWSIGRAPKLQPPGRATLA